MWKRYITTNKRDLIATGEEPPRCTIIKDGRQKSPNGIYANMDIPMANTMFDRMIDQGYVRTTQNGAILKTNCRSCDACKPVRVDLSTFNAHASRAFRKNLSRNEKIYTQKTLSEKSLNKLMHQGVYKDFMLARHNGPFSGFIESLQQSLMHPDTTLEVMEFYKRPQTPDQQPDAFVGALWWYNTSKGPYLNFYYYDPDENKNGLGTYIRLKAIEEAQKKGAPHAYLGSWTEEKSRYYDKARFADEVYDYESKKWLPLDDNGFRHS